MRPRHAQTKESLFKRARVKKSGCWHFIGSLSKTGYGVVGLNGKVIGAHRAAWILTNGEVPDGLFVCHKCDNRRCINPDHLFLGTAKDNTQDMISKGRRVGRNRETAGNYTVCKRGHTMTPETTRTNKLGHRSCKQCEMARYHEKKAKQ